MATITLDVDLRPGEGLGIFELGSSLWSVLDLLRHNTTLFPRIDIKYDVDAAVTTPVLVHIPPHLDLLFSGKQQRLRSVALRRLHDKHPPVSLVYKGLELASPMTHLRRGDVSRHFGPTYAGEGLHYPGVSFLFEEEGVGTLAEGFKGAGSTSPGKDDRHKEVKRVIVSQISGDGVDNDALEEVAECPCMAGSLRQAIIKFPSHSNPEMDGIILHFYPSVTRAVHVRIGVTSAQDLICDLGAPLRTYYKEDERMAIHSRNKIQDGEDGYFYNYFQYGMDFLLSSTTHLVQKIILHTNIPGTPMFQRHQRCPWEIEGEPEDEEDDTPPCVTFSDKFDVISHFLNHSTREQLPSMQLDRAEDERLTLPNSTTRLVRFEGIVLEVTEAAQIATVVLF